MKKAVIVGGGFGGVRLARKLGRHTPVTLINDSANFRYSPTLYRAATGKRLASVDFPLAWMLLDVPNVQLKIDRAVSVDPKSKTINLESKESIQYDYAAFALGSVTTYFNIKGLFERSFGIKSREEVEELRSHLHASAIDKKTSQNYVIVGAGPTGVELAGALAKQIQHISRKHHIRSQDITIWLVDAAPRVLPRMDERSSRYATKRLEKAGVKLLMNTQVNSETSQSLHTSNGSIKTHTVIWTAGTANNPFFKDNSATFKTNERGLVDVNDRLQASPSIYVIGDNAAAPHAGLAFSAIMNANFVAKDIRNRVKNKKRYAYNGVRPVQIVPTGGRTATLQYGKLVLNGYVPGLIRTAADYVGYSDVMGYLKALTIWRFRNNTEENCDTCFSRK